MRLPKRGERGFTLIELLIVIAILGVLAAVVIPNVGRFIGRGEKESALAELHTIQSAVQSMMVDNGISVLAVPATTATNDMFAFPDIGSNATTKNLQGKAPNGKDWKDSDKPGWTLYEHDVIADDTSNTTGVVNYIATRYSKGTYNVDRLGTVTQNTTGY